MLQTIVRIPDADADISLGSEISKMQGRPIGPEDVTAVLDAAGLRYVLVGAHAANAYTGRPRATVDVDIVVQNPKKAAAAVAAAFPQLVATDTPVVTRFKDAEHEAIDLMKPAGSKLWSRLLKESREIRIGKSRVRVPTLEGMLAAKFASMVSPMRRLPDKQQDGVDFIRMVEANKQINEKLTAQLGELVYAGGGKEILKLAADARAGKRLEF